MNHIIEAFRLLHVIRKISCGELLSDKTESERLHVIYEKIVKLVGDS